MEACDGPFIATPQFFVFEASNVPCKPETEKLGTENYREENTFYLAYAYRQRQSLFSRGIRPQ